MSDNWFCFMEKTFDNAIIDQPKVILHTHLEGSVPGGVLELLSRRNNVPLSFEPSATNISPIIETHNWNSFRKVYYEICSCFVNGIDFYDSLLAYGKKLCRENVIYAEIQFSPWKHISRNVSVASISEALIDAIEDLEATHGITIRIITDLVRHKDEDCDSILDWLRDAPRKYFVGLGISGGANAVPRKLYKPYCHRAKDMGLRITSHAGEIEDSTSVREVIDYWNTDRIGHGVGCIENAELLDEVISKRIHCEICPTANRIVGLATSYNDPIRNFIEAGVNFSINPDDEFIFRTNITHELNELASNGLLQAQDITNMQKNALVDSFLDTDLRNDLIQEYFSGN